MNRQHWITLFILVVMVYAAVPALNFSPRERRYRRELKVFAAALKPGMKRADVEAYLHSQNLEFGRFCCTGNYRGAMDDLVAIGHQKQGLICEERNVFVAFRFVATNPSENGVIDSDVFVGTTLFRSACLDLT